jgi:hypothetical protein
LQAIRSGQGPTRAEEAHATAVPFPNATVKDFSTPAYPPYLSPAGAPFRRRNGHADGLARWTMGVTCPTLGGEAQALSHWQFRKRQMPGGSAELYFYFQCQSVPGGFFSHLETKDTGCQYQQVNPPSLEFFDRFNVDCGAGSVLVSWKMVTSGCLDEGHPAKIEYVCGKLLAPPVKSEQLFRECHDVQLKLLPELWQAGMQSPSVLNTHSLPLCAVGTVLSAWKMTADGCPGGAWTSLNPPNSAYRFKQRLRYTCATMGNASRHLYQVAKELLNLPISKSLPR